MTLSDRIDPEIVNNITEKYKDASIWTPFTAIDIKQIFSTEEDLNKLEEFVVDMHNAATENERKTRLINNIQKYAGTLVKLFKISRIAV